MARSHSERGSAVVTDDRVYLGDILERIERIEAYTQGGREEFLRSLLIQDGVIRSFEVIGEAVKWSSGIYQSLRARFC